MEDQRDYRLTVKWQSRSRQETILVNDCLAHGDGVRVPIPVEGPNEIGRLEFEASGSPGESAIEVLAPAVTTLTRRTIVEPTTSHSLESSIRQGGLPNIVFYLVDTLRRDGLGCYGSAKGLTPNIDRFADRTTVFERAIAQSPWTKASVASIFTALVPRKHAEVEQLDLLAEQHWTLAELLASEGYQTAAFVSNLNASEKFGFAQGFEDFQFSGRASSTELNEMVATWFETKRDPKRPLFLYVHTIDPHAPYEPPSEFGEKFASGIEPKLDRKVMFRGGRSDESFAHVSDLRALYDAEVAFNDHSFGSFMSFLEANDRAKSSLILFSTDHGEEFLDHGWWRHGQSLYEEIVGIPLIIRFPGQDHGVREASLAQHVDILPTILDLLGSAPLPGLQGQSLSVVTTDRFERLGLSEMARGKFKAVSIVDGHWKLIRKSRIGRERVDYELYDLFFDQHEITDVSESNVFVTEYLKGKLAMVEAELGEAATVESLEALTQEDTEELRVLGYIE